MNPVSNGMDEDLKLWDDSAKDWPSMILPTRTLAAELIGNALVRNFPDLYGKQVLDAGCGDGQFLPVMLKAGASVTAVDGSPKMVELASKNFPGLDVLTADLTGKLPFPDSKFDLIVSLLVLMSLRQIDTFLAESYRTLKSDGSFFICVFHPAFNFPTMKLYRSLLGKLMGKKVRGLAEDYFMKTSRRKDDASDRAWPFYHRTLSEYSESFARAGFVLKNISEPHELNADYLKKYPKHEYAARLPRFIIFTLQK